MIKTIKKPYHTGLTKSIRDAAKNLGEQSYFSKRDVFYHVDDCNPVNFCSFHRCWYDLRKRGEIVRIGSEKYQYINQLKPTADVRNKIIRAMHIKGAFCSKDIFLLTDADISYILAIIRKLVNRGYLEFTGKTDRGNIFRVKHNVKFYQELMRGI